MIANNASSFSRFSHTRVLSYENCILCKTYQLCKDHLDTNNVDNNICKIIGLETPIIAFYIHILQSSQGV